MKTFFKTYARFIYPAVILLVSLSIYFPYYGNPQAMFWDENYHVANAQKHIDGMMYMEPHPPLGKMFMAIGEVLFGDNGKVNKQPLLVTDYLTGDAAPPEMTYKGFRWPSTVLMAPFGGFLFRNYQLHYPARLACCCIYEFVDFR